MNKKRRKEYQEEEEKEAFPFYNIEIKKNKKTEKRNENIFRSSSLSTQRLLLLRL